MHRLSLFLVPALVLLSFGGPVNAASGFGAPVTVAGTAGEGQGADQLYFPKGVSVDGDGNLFVADSENHRVQMVPADGSATVTVAGTGMEGSGVDQLNGPFGIAVDGAGNVFVADTGNDRVLMVPADGSATVTVAGTGGEGSGVDQLNNPFGVAVDGAGNVFVADTGNDRVLMVPADGSATVTVAGTGGQGSGVDQLDHPSGVSVDGAGNVFVADTLNDRVQMIPADGSATVTVAGTGGEGSGVDQLAFPRGLTVDGVGNVFVADTANDRVQMVPADGSATVTVAGTGGHGPGPDQLNDPFGVSVDGDGSLFVADRLNDRVQKLAAPDTIDPVATIAAPMDGSTAVVGGDEVVVEFSCVDEQTVVSCEGMVDGAAIATGGSVDTGTVGTKTLSVTATDGAGNTHVVSAVITIEESAVVVPDPVACKRGLQGAYAGLAGTDGALARLYMATFARQPDADGFEFWSTAIEDGTHSLSFATRHFTVSDEFAASYGSLDDGEFIDQIYDNVLCRTPDEAGKAYWLNRLDTGTDRGRLVRMFSDSPEFRTLTTAGATT